MNDAIAAAAARGVSIIGLHQHIGSGVLEPRSYIGAAGVLLGIVERYAAALPDLAYVDIGGGIGVAYRPGDVAISLPELGPMLTARFAETAARVAAARAAAGGGGAAAGVSPPLQLLLEPGRFLVAESGYLLATVSTIKETPYGRTYCGVNTGFNHLVRPAMYDAYHYISHHAADGGGDQTHGIGDGDSGVREYVVAGNVCESGDVFSPDGARALGSARRAVAEGDMIVLHTAGAYGYSMASEYNTRARPAEYAIDAPSALRRWVAAGEFDGQDALLGRPGPVLELPHAGGGESEGALCVTRARSVAELVAEAMRGGF